MRRKAAACCRFLGALLLAAAILSCLPVAIPQAAGYRVYSIVSGSMEPELPVGSLIYVKRTDAQKVAAGDVIAFEKEGSVVSHRVVENNTAEEEFTTKGDANAEEDLRPVPYEALIGRVEAHVPYLGVLSVLYSSLQGKLSMIGFACAGAVLLLLAGRLRDQEAGRTSEESGEEA